MAKARNSGSGNWRAKSAQRRADPNYMPGAGTARQGRAMSRTGRSLRPYLRPRKGGGASDRGRMVGWTGFADTGPLE